MKYLIVLVLVITYAIAIRFINRNINRLGELKNTDPYRIKYIAKRSI